MYGFDLGLLVAAAAAAVTMLTAPAALALSESTMKRECAAADVTDPTTDHGPGSPQL